MPLVQLQFLLKKIIAQNRSVVHNPTAAGFSDLSYGIRTDFACISCFGAVFSLAFFTQICYTDIWEKKLEAASKVDAVRKKALRDLRTELHAHIHATF